MSYFVGLAARLNRDTPQIFGLLADLSDFFVSERQIVKIFANQRPQMPEFEDDFRSFNSGLFSRKLVPQPDLQVDERISRWVTE